MFLYLVHYDTLLQKSTDATNLHKETNFHQRSDTVTHLGQITLFDPFLGTQGVKWGSKRVKNCPFH